VSLRTPTNHAIHTNVGFRSSTQRTRYAVLSKSTRKKDTTFKLLSYINIPSLQEYVLIEQDFVDVQVFSRNEGWLVKHYFLGDELTLQSINLTLSVAEIYHRVQNDDMVEFLANNKA
jgi:hypothetical protein